MFLKKDQGYFRIWECSPYLHKHTTGDQSDSGIALHSTDMQTNNQSGVLDDSCSPVCQLANNSAPGTSNAETIPLKAMREHTTMSNAELQGAAEQK